MPNEKMQPPPPYSKTTYCSRSDPDPHTHHLIAIVDDEIVPILRSRFERGHDNATVALLLMAQSSNSDIRDDDHRNPKSADVLHPASDDELHGQVLLSNFMGFVNWWESPGINARLAKAVRQACIHSDQSDTEKRSKGSSLTKADLPPSYIRSPTTNTSRLAENSVHVEVKLDEICFRTISDFGLYDTITKPAVLVRVVFS